jgi:hypothetical protein
VNVSIPRFKAWLNDSYMGVDQETVTPCVVFGASSIPGRAIGWHVLTEDGAMIFRLPIEAITTKPDAELIPTHVLELWNAFSYDMEVIEFDFLEGMRCQVKLRDGSIHGGSYLFTLDWYGSADAEDVGDLGHKCGHVIELDGGQLAIQPNNRIRWFESSFTDNDAPLPPYRTIDRIWRCEQYGRLTTGEGMFYEVEG